MAGRRKDATKIINQQHLAREINEVLLLPLIPHLKMSKPYKIVRIVVNTIKEALLRGESVQIQGFGTFSVKESKKRKRKVVYFYGRNEKHSAIVDVEPKKYAFFHPSRGLKGFVNQGVEDES